MLSVLIVFSIIVNGIVIYTVYKKLKSVIDKNQEDLKSLIYDKKLSDTEKKYDKYKNPEGLYRT